MKYLVFIIVIFNISNSWASTDLIKRVAVFPIQVQKEYRNEADKSWWSIREELSRSKRFLVASRLFLQKNEVFQARSELEPADAIILGKLLDAHALITCFVREQQIHFNVYSGKNGDVLWKTHLFLDPDIPTPRQVSQKSLKLMRAFMADIPYQGHQVAVTDMGEDFHVEGDVRIANVDIGKNHYIEVGHKVQWVQLERKKLEPSLQGGAEVQIVGEGKVLSVEGHIAQVEVLRYKNLSDLSKNSLVRFPLEAERLQKLYSISNNPIDKLLRRAGNLREDREKEPKNKSLSTALSFIGSLALLLVLAL